MACELCHRDSGESKLCEDCWQMIGRVKAAQDQITLDSIKKALKAMTRRV